MRTVERFILTAPRFLRVLVGCFLGLGGSGPGRGACAASFTPDSSLSGKTFSVWRGLLTRVFDGFGVWRFVSGVSAEFPRDKNGFPACGGPRFFADQICGREEGGSEGVAGVGPGAEDPRSRGRL
jgi:hypothetical protein